MSTSDTHNASNGTDLAVVEGSQYLALSRDTGEIQQIMQDNLAGQEVNEFDLPRITVPPGGGTRWEVYSPLSGTQSLEELSGIVVYQRQARAYWADSDPSGEPPQCSSRDAIVGVGDPGGECRTCPHAQWGSHEDGRGQACKQQTMWFLLREESFLPVVVALPATSLKAGREYMLALSGAGIRAAEVVTTIGLEKDKNPDGQSYSRAVPRVGARLDDAAAGRAREYAEILRPIFDAQSIVVEAAKDGE